VALRSASTGVWLAALTVGVLAQAPVDRIVFEAASVKPNTSGGSSDATFQAGRFTARNATVRGLISSAFGDPLALPPQRIAGGPPWADTDHFDIQARAALEFPEASSGSEVTATGRAMLRALLVDRFRLATHWEKRDLPVYLLIRRSDARADPRLVSSAGKPGTDCQPAADAAAAGGPLPRCGSYLLQNTGGNQFAIHARGITMPSFARNLQNVAGRLVVDRTALPGPYSFDLDFEYRPPSATAADEGIGAAIFTAVQDQLGLRLESARLPVDVLAIDHVERPTEN
jgi:uncharacterized protein (TIGR03435 family)